METRQVTPTAKRNSYRVARGAGEAPPLALPKGRESYLAVD